MKKNIFVFLLILCLAAVCIAVRHYYSPKISYSKITFSSWGSQSEVKILKNIISEFENNNPDIKVEFLHIPQNYFQKIQLLFASNLPPDVVFFNNQYIQMYIKANLLEDLSEYFPDYNKDFYSEAVNCFTSKNGIYAIPRDISNLVIFYNKDIFRQMKIKIPDKINNIFELKNIAQKLTNDRYYGINTEDIPMYWLYFLSSQSAGAISDDKKHIIINSEASKNALNLYSDFSNKYHIAPTKSQIGSITTAQMFINSKLAMYISGRWMVPKFRETISFDWDIMPFPNSDNNKLYIDASGWAVSKNSKNKEAAIKFIKYLSSKHAIEEFTKSGLIVPARRDVANSDIFLDITKRPENAKAFIETVKYSKPTPVNENYQEISDILYEKGLLIFESKIKPEEAFDAKTVKKLESLL